MEKNNFDSNYTLNKPTSKFRGFGLFVAMFWAFFLALALSNVISPYLSNIINGLFTGIAPLIIGIVVAFIFYRLVDFTEKFLLKNAFKNSPYKFGLKRFISISIVLLIIVGIIVIIFSILVPKVVSVVQELTSGGNDGWAQMVNNVVNEICSLIQRWFGAEVDQVSIKNVLNSLFDQLQQTINYIGGLTQISMSVLTGIFNFFIGMILAILILKDKEKITRFSRRFVYANFKKERADEMCVMAHNSSKILFDYVICKLIEFAILFVSLGITYSIMGLKFTWELALIIGIFNFIPYFGIYIGTIPAVLLTMIFNSLDMALYMVIATVIITTIEFNILIPIITGNKLKVSALLVASSIIIGGAMFGMVGMLLAPPIIAIISVIVTGNIELKENHMRYVMELNASREKQKQEQRESMGLPEQETNSDIDEQKPKVKKLSKTSSGNMYRVTSAEIMGGTKSTNKTTKKTNNAKKHDIDSNNQSTKKNTKKSNVSTKKVSSSKNLSTQKTDKIENKVDTDNNLDKKEVEEKSTTNVLSKPSNKNSTKTTTKKTTSKKTLDKEVLQEGNEEK